MKTVLCNEHLAEYIVSQTLKAYRTVENTDLLMPFVYRSGNFSTECV